MDRVEKMDDITIQKSEVVKLGPIELMTDAGPTIFWDAVLCTNGDVTMPDESRKVVIMATSCIQDAAGYWVGAVAQFTPDEARTFAATLCQVADKIDGGIKSR